jgi:hypothetical protein
LEDAGLIEEAAFFGGGAMTWRITDRGKKWLEETPT